MSEPGRQELPPKPGFETQFLGQIEDTSAMFSLDEKNNGIEILLGKQTSQLRDAIAKGDSEDIVKNAAFKFVAPIRTNKGPMLQRFGLVANAVIDKRSAAAGETGRISYELQVVAANSNLNTKGTVAGKEKILLEPQVFSQIMPYAFKNGVDRRLRRFLFPKGFVDRITNKLY